MKMHLQAKRTVTPASYPVFFILCCQRFVVHMRMQQTAFSSKKPTPSTVLAQQEPLWSHKLKQALF